MPCRMSFRYAYEQPFIVQDGCGATLYKNEDIQGRVQPLGEDQSTVAYERIVQRPGHFLAQDLTKDQQVQRSHGKPFRYEAWKFEWDSGQGSDWSFSHIVTDMQAVRAETHYSMPSHIYRIFGDQTAGINEDGLFRSEAVRQGQAASMESMSESDIKDNLRSHLRKRIFPSHWISFSISLLWEWDLALRKKSQGEKGLKIAVINTLRLPKGIQIFHAGALLTAFEVEKEIWPKNIGAAEFLVWDELEVPADVFDLDAFFRSEIQPDGHRRPGYLQLHPFHLKPLPESFFGISEALSNHARHRIPAPAQIRRKKYQQEDRNHQQEESIRVQAPKLWKERYTAGRVFYNEKTWYSRGENQRVGISPHELLLYVDFVKRSFSVELQFHMLIWFLSTRLDYFERSSVVEAVPQALKEDPMISNYKCFVRPARTPYLPEVDTFEDLLKACSKVCNIKIKFLNDLPPRKFLTLITPKTQLPRFDEKNRQFAEMFSTQAERGIQDGRARGQLVEDWLGEKELELHSLRIRLRSMPHGIPIGMHQYRGQTGLFVSTTVAGADQSGSDSEAMDIDCDI